jgi:hypothetical protein
MDDCCSSAVVVESPAPVIQPSIPSSLNLPETLAVQATDDHDDSVLSFGDDELVSPKDLRNSTPLSTQPKFPPVQFDGRQSLPFAALPSAASTRKPSNRGSSTKFPTVCNLNHKQLDFLLFHQMLEPVDPSNLCFLQKSPPNCGQALSSREASGASVEDPPAVEEDDASLVESVSSHSYESIASDEEEEEEEEEKEEEEGILDALATPQGNQGSNWMVAK